MAHFTINDIEIKNPSTFKVERYNVTNMQRLADASMAGDLIAQKLKYYFTYDAITAEEFENILNAIWYTGELFFPLEYDYNGDTNYSYVYVGSIPADLHRGGAEGNWVWKDVTFNLIER